MKKPFMITTGAGFMAFSPEEIRSMSYDRDGDYFKVWFKPPIPEGGLTAWGVSPVTEHEAMVAYRKWYRASDEDS